MTWLREAKLLLTAGPGGVTPWRIDEDGVPTPVAGAPFGAGPGLYFGVAAAARGRDRFAWVADFGASHILGYRVGDDGSLAPSATATRCRRARARSASSRGAAC